MRMYCQVVVEKHDDVERFCGESAEVTVAYAAGNDVKIIPMCMKHSDILDAGTSLVVASGTARWLIIMDVKEGKENDANDGTTTNGATTRDVSDPLTNEARGGA